MTQAEYTQLVERINSLSTSYYSRGVAEIPDAEFDKLWQQLAQVETEHPEWVTRNSPSLRVVSDHTAAFAKRPHRVPMLSLDNIFEPEELERRLVELAELAHGKGCLSLPSGVPIWTFEPKVDGMSLDLCYEDGYLVKALTRGNGTTGDDVTKNARMVQGIQKQLTSNSITSTQSEHAGHAGPVEPQPIPKILHIRGEVYISDQDFAAVNQERAARGEELFANARNAVVGAMKHSDPEICRQRRPSFMAYRLFSPDNGILIYNQTDVHKNLAMLGFRTFEVEHVSHTSLKQDALLWVEEFGKQRKALGYPVDGLVIKLWDVRQQLQIKDGQRSVRWAYAFKYDPDKAVTRLNGVTLQVGRSGVLTPVAELEPVELGGTEIARASLHNKDHMNKLGLCIGDEVEIVKAGEIIPQVTQVITRHPESTPFVFPDSCPSCNGPVARRLVGEEGEEGAAIECRNTGCPARKVAKLEYWCSKAAMDIPDVGPAIAESLVNAGIDTPLEMYLAAEGDGLGRANLGITITENLRQNILASKERGMACVLVGLGIPGLGNTLSKKLAKAYPDIPAMLAIPTDKLASLHGINKRAAAGLDAWHNDEAEVKHLRRMAEIGVSLTSKSYNPNIIDSNLSGKTFVFTGTLESMDRDKAQAVVEEMGARCTGSVSKKTDYLVAGYEPGASKISKAKQLGLKVMSEDEFLQLIA
jgi:DNA ligase (NAD+)